MPLITDLSADARAVADIMLATPVGETVTHDAISAAIGRDAATRRHVVSAARRVALREGGAVFASERGVGYRRLSAAEVAETVGPGARDHIRRSARRAHAAIAGGTAAANDLPAALQRRAAAEISALSLVEHLCRDAPVKPAEDGLTKPTPVAVTARAMLGYITGERPAAR